MDTYQDLVAELANLFYTKSYSIILNTILINKLDSGLIFGFQLYNSNTQDIPCKKLLKIQYHSKICLRLKKVFKSIQLEH